MPCGLDFCRPDCLACAEEEGILMSSPVGTLKAHDGGDNRGIRPQRRRNQHYETPNFMFHLDLLHEWNESHIWYPKTTNIQHTESGCVVSSECLVHPAPGEYDDSKPRHEQEWVEHVVAMYADDDHLFRLVCFHNDYTAVVVNDGPMRA